MCGLTFVAELRNYKHEKISDVHVRCWNNERRRQKHKPIFLTGNTNMETTIKFGNSVLNVVVEFVEKQITPSRKYVYVYIRMDSETRKYMRQLFANYIATKLDRQSKESEYKDNRKISVSNESQDRLPISLNLRQFAGKYITIHRDRQYVYAISLYRLLLLLQRYFREQVYMFLHTGTRSVYIDIQCQ